MAEPELKPTRYDAPKLLVEKDKRIKELEADRRELMSGIADFDILKENAILKAEKYKSEEWGKGWANKAAELENTIDDLKAELKNEQGKRGIGINQVLIDENKNLKAKIAEANGLMDEISKSIAWYHKRQGLLPYDFEEYVGERLRKLARALKAKGGANK